MFVPLDLSVLFTRRPDVVRAAFSILPDYLRTAEETAVPNLMDYGVSLGRRFRALKLWMVLRAFGHEGMAARIREHIRLAREFEAWVRGDERFEVMAPAPFSVVCFRGRFARLPEAEQDAANQRLMDAVNASGEVYLSHTRLRGRLTLRMAIANLRTRERHVRRAWELLQEEAGSLGA
jgi:aromatic-L-amino-acid decarboxylase